MLRRLILSAALGISTRASADDLTTLTDEALQHNPTLRGIDLDAAIAGARVLQADGLEDVHLSVAASFTSAQTPLLPGTPLEATGYNDANASVQIARTLPWGGSFALGLSFDYIRTHYASDDGGDVPPTTTGAYVPFATFSVVQPLLRGLRPSIARAPRHRARAELDAAKLRALATATLVARDLQLAYFEYAYASEERTVRESSLALARQQLEVVRAQIDVGKRPPSASAEVQVAVALREDELASTNASLSLRFAEVARLVGDPARAMPEQLPALAECRAVVPPDLASKISAVAPDLLAARASLPAARLDARVAENGLLPELLVSATVGLDGDAPSIRTSFAQLGGFGS